MHENYDELEIIMVWYIAAVLKKSCNVLGGVDLEEG